MKLANIAGALMLATIGVGFAAKPAAAQQPLLNVSNINVTGVRITGSNTLVASLDVVGELSDQPFSLNGIRVPMTLDQTGTTEDGCPILSLSLEIERLNILGLVVELNDCDEGPITVDITAVPGDGNLLGNLLCALVGPNGLLGDLNLLSRSDRRILSGAIQSLLDEIFADALADAGDGDGASAAQEPPNDASPNACEILTLELGPIDLDLLGLVVETSEICLFVYAEPDGGLLGRLLCNLTNLLDRGANQNALNALARQVNRVLSRLGL